MRIRRQVVTPQRPPLATPAPSPAPAASGVARSAEVVLDVDVEQGRVYLVLVNCGDAAALRVAVEFSRDLLGPEGASVSALPLFTRLGVLRPGRAIRVFWHAAPALLAAGSQELAFTASVSWEEAARPRQRAVYQHDLSVYRHLPECI